MLKQATRTYGTPNDMLTVIYWLTLALGVGATALSVYYLASSGESSTNMGTKIMFCIILTLSQAAISVVAVDALGQLVLFYVPAHCLLKRHVGSVARPRERDQEMGRPSMCNKVLTSSAAAAVDSIGDSASSGGASALEVAGSAVAAAAKEAALDAATLEALRKLQPKLEPVANKRGIEWKQVKDAAMGVSAEQLEQAIDDPAAFLESILPAIKEAALDARRLSARAS